MLDKEREDQITSEEGSDDLEQDPLAVIRRRWNLDGTASLGSVPAPMRPLLSFVIRDMRWLVNELVQARSNIVFTPTFAKATPAKKVVPKKSSALFPEIVLKADEVTEEEGED